MRNIVEIVEARYKSACDELSRQLDDSIAEDMKRSLERNLMENLKQLNASAEKLNKASDDLCFVISNINQELKAMNLGVATWSGSLGYVKINGYWGLAIRREETGEEWLYQEAPRALRVIAIKEWPALVGALRSETEALTNEVLNATKEAELFYESLSSSHA